MPLKVEGTKLTGTGQSQEAKAPIVVNLARKQTGKTVTFEGSVTRGGNKVEVLSTGNTDMNEQEFQESQATESSIVAEPADFVELSPGSVAVRAKRDAVGALVKEIKGQNVELLLDGLARDCSVLRTGEQEIVMLVDPDRAADLVKKLKGVSGVLDVGWTSGSYSIDRSVRLGAADWKGGSGAFDKPRIGKAIADSLAKHFSATVENANWNATTGELKVDLKRPSQAVPGFDLADRIELVLLVGPKRSRGTTA